MAASNTLAGQGLLLENGGTSSIKKQNGKLSHVHCPVVMPRNPKLIRGEPVEQKQAPSAFIAEMQLTTDEKLKRTCEMRVPQIIELLDMSETTHQKFTSLEIDEPIFQPFPSDIVFQNFEPYETYQVPLKLRNNDKVARLIKVTETDSAYFKVISPSDVGHKVAPGMDKVFMLQFTAEQKKDYFHELICVTEREKFIIPVKAIGERAIIDFPDSVNFGSCPVKDTATKTLFVRNIGKREAKFSLSLKSPFSVTPDKGSLAVGESMQVHVDFKALKTGDYDYNMVLHYDTGEDVYITLYGAAVDVNVRLDKSTLKLENTFISCISQRTVLIHNRSEHIVNFRWTRFATLTEELQHKERCKLDLKREEEMEKDVFLMECAQDVTIRDQMSILQRSFQTRGQMVDADKLIYKDDVLEVQPSEGVIWPNSSMEINVVFTPLEAQSYARTMYCDVAGRESRLPLRIRGEGIGPRVMFSLDCLDIGNIFVNSNHSYEVVLANKGDIDAVYSYIDSQSMFGPLFTFSPSQGIVRPGGYQAIKIDFCSPILGNLNEDFFWAIEGSPEKLVFNIQGCVIGPTFHFDVPRLDFGVISYGFPNQMKCSLINTSLIPMTFTLRVPADEVEGMNSFSAITSDYYNQESRETRRREFEITPVTATLTPQSTQEIQIDLVSMTVKKYDVSLVVDVEGVGEEIASLPLLAKCVVPGINLLTPVLDFGKCFVNHPYEMTMELMNDSDLPAKYEVIAQVAENHSGVLFSSPEPKGILHSRTISKVPLQITAERPEERYTVAYLLIHGSNDPPLEVEIRCFGEGPVVHVSPMEIDWGNIPVLADVEKCLTLSNESLIPARFTCNTARDKSSFSVHPVEGVVPAEEDMKIVVTANVDDCLRFQDKLFINIGGMQVHTINVMAYGMGTTIVSDPPLMPTVNFGPQFSHNTCSKVFKLTNNGRRSQQLYWMTEGFSNYKAKLKKERQNKELDKITQDILNTPSSVGPVFKLTPERLSLDPGQSHKIKMEGFSLTPQIVREKMICHSIIGNSIGKEVIMRVNVKAEFISPLLHFSERKINFCVLKYPGTKLERKTKELLMENVSSLPLSMSLRVEYPFQFIRHERQTSDTSEVSLDVKKSIPIMIEFDPGFENNAFSRTAKRQLVVTYKDHPHEDYLELTGGVYYPNLTFETDEVDFGCILNDTEVARSVLVTNNSPMDVKYHWSFVDSDLRIEKIVTLNEKAAVVAAEEQPEAADENEEEMSIILPDDLKDENEPDDDDFEPEIDVTSSDLGIQEVFDILPLYSTLKPNESQRIQFTFYGHSGVRAKAMARCSVDGGPDYDLMLEGSASLASYFFNKKNVKFGKQLYDQMAVSEIILYNSGKVGLDFVTNLEATSDEMQPGKITVTPSRGHVKALQKQNIVIKYMPGIPTKFKKSFTIRVGHFEPEQINLTGEGVFPRIALDLPRDIESDNFKQLLEVAKTNLANVENIDDDEEAVFMENSEDRNNVMDELMEVERLQVINFALEQRNNVKNGVDPSGSNHKKGGTKKTKPKAQLLDYVLDFGYVVSDTVPEYTFHAANCGYFPASFMADKQSLHNSGFTIHMDRVKNLPGFPDPENVTITVVFDPKNANIPEGPVRSRVPISILNGPVVGIILKAIVTTPDMALSTNILDFGVVQCGQCKLMTMQLLNDQHVSCQWSSEPAEGKKKKVDKITPLHLRKKLKAEPPLPKHFEVMPPFGVLAPGQRINVQVKFMPTEEMTYNQRLKIRIAQTTTKHVITVRGEGSEPKVEFTSSVLEFGPILPHFFGDEKEVTVQNPSSFPVEIYSLEFDKQYLEEEKILRAMKGYDEYNTILLPPRNAGEQLPSQLSDHFYEQEKTKEENEKKRVEAVAKMFDEQLKGSQTDLQISPHSEVSHSAFDEETAVEDSTKIPQDTTEIAKEDSEPEKTDVGELEITPVSAAIANYIGIDLSLEGRAARNRRGISIVVHGAPLSGKTSTAIELSKLYNAVLLNVDTVVTEAIQLGATTAGIRARELCAASAKSVKEAEEGKDNALAGALSVEAVAAHTAQTSGQVVLSGTASAIGVQSSIKESRRATNFFGPKGSQVSKSQQPAQPSPPSSPQASEHPPRRLSVSASVAGEDGMYSCILPEDLLVEILAERMQVNDCHLGIIIDGLDSMFTRNNQSTASCVLRALNNRKYIFFLTLTLDRAKLKAIDERKKEETRRKEREEEAAEKKWLEEMSEDEYDALSEQQKNDVDRKRLNQKKEKMRKEEEERLEKERKEKEQLALLEEKRLEEEKDKKGRRKTVQQASQMRKGAPDSKEGERKREKTSDKMSGSRSVAQIHEHSGVRGANAPSVISERSDSVDPPGGDERKRPSVIKMSKQRQASALATHARPVIAVDDKLSEEDEKEKELVKKFQKFEVSLRDVSSLLENWDRSTGNVVRVDTPKSETEPEVTQTGSNKKMRDKKSEKEKEKMLKENMPSPRDSFVFPIKDEVKSVNKDGIGIPHVIFETTASGESQKDKLLSMTTLPTPQEILDGLGLGPNGPPIPPPVTFAVIPYPVRRNSPFASDTSLHYLFVASGPNDPNVAVEEKAKKADPEIEKADSRSEKEHSSRSKGTAAKISREKDEPRESGPKSKRDRVPSSGKTARKSSMSAASSPPPQTQEDGRLSGEGASTTNAVLSTHRWVLPANGSCLLRIRFKSEDLGQFDQTLNFEIVGTRRRYQVFCRGVCAFPSISREPRIVFQNRRKIKKREEIVHKKFILNSETYEFGPLLCGKTREKYKEGKYPENMETITISNTSPLPAEVSFCFQHDNNGTTFLLDPPNMSLPCGASETLTMWAYPKTSGALEDVLVCCVRENPEPILFKISCHGVRPELELDRKQLPFDRVLLHRKDTKTVFLRNSTLLPVQWRLNGLENLGDDFSVVTDHGVIEPRSEYGLQVHFRAARPVTVKKVIRLEVSDVEQIMGLVQAENIQVIGEAYDVALDISFPKGADGGLDFGVLKVFDESKQSMSLKNKGRYEISYNFVFDTTKNANVTDLLTIVPQKGVLIPTERHTQVAVIFRSRNEVSFKDETMLKCQIIEPHIGGSGEVIASIPVKISVRSVHSKYTIYPVHDINFGAALVNTKKTRTFTIENKGEFDFRYTIMKMINALGRQKQVGPSQKREGSGSNRSQQPTQQHQGSISLGAGAKPRRADSVKGSEHFGGGAPNIRQQIGMFTLYPAVGLISPAASMQVTIDMMGENPGYSEELLAIDITDRQPSDNPHGIPYKLIGEAATPGISVISPEYIGSVFEEHRVVQSLSRFQFHSAELDSGTGVYGEQENKFMFFNSIVGRKSYARFKITNPNKISCDVVITVRPISSKASAKWHDVYEVSPSRACIGRYGSLYVTVTFTPPAMQAYSAIFEAAVDGMTGVVSRYRSLTFDIQGDGNLPRVGIQRPAIRNKSGNLIMLFKPLLLGRAQMLPLVLTNDGNLDADVKMTLTDPEKSFSITRTSLSQDDGIPKDSVPPKHITPNDIFFRLPTSKSIEFSVQCKPTITEKVIGEIRFSVRDNPYEENALQLMGEGYKEDVTIDNIINGDGTKDVVDNNAVESDGNQVYFGDCSIGVAKKVSFTMTNHLEHDAVRFSWSSLEGLTFVPCIGHLLANCAKDISLSFNSDKPITLDNVRVNCNVTKIKLAEDGKKAVDWDDRMRTVKWIDFNGRTTTREDGLSSGGQQATSEFVKERATKKKIYETETEPAHTVIDPDQPRTLSIGVSAKVDYSSCECPVNLVHFKDTLMFQTRVYSFNLSNTSPVSLDYALEVIEDASQSSLSEHHPPVRTSSQSSGLVQDATFPCSRPTTAMEVVFETGSISSCLLSDSLPFSVEPSHGRIPAGESVPITVRFAPCDITEYQGLLKFTIPNVDPESHVPEVKLKGRSLLPYCHFELEESDYITGGRRNPELPGPWGAAPGTMLNPNTKVIEFQSCGVKVKVTREFFIVNPTDMDLNFVWTREDPSDSRGGRASLTCTPKEGLIESGKKIQMKFEYISNNLELTESFWRFFIQEHNISLPFLLVGHTTEPNVSLDRSHFNFREILVDFPAEQTVYLVNEEEKAFNFSFDEDSCHADAHAARLFVEPMSGCIPAKSRIPLVLRFTPTAQKEINFNVVCKVKKKTVPLTLNVKAEGFALNASLICEDSAGEKIELTSSGSNRIQFGEIEMNERALRQLFVINSGKFNFDFTWILDNKSKLKHENNKPVVSIGPQKGTVPCNSRKRCMLTFCPPKKCTLKDCTLIFKITNGPTYKIDITGIGIRPSIKFSFNRFDFGACFLYRAGIAAQRSTLVITNEDSKDINVQCKYENTAYLEVQSQPSVLPSGESADVNILFYPRECKRYHEVIPFEINGLSLMSVDVLGQGTEIKVGVCNRDDRKVNFGALRVGQSAERIVKLRNNSAAAITFSLVIIPSLPVLQQSSVLSVSPSSEITLEPNGASCNVHVMFTPTTRIPQFTEEVTLECAGLCQTVFLVSGTCQAVDIKLDTTSVPFGAVVIGSQSSRVVVMQNLGDIGARFSWNVNEFSSDFSVEPIKGYSSPGTEVSFQLTFSPQKVSQDIRSEVSCMIEGDDRPLRLVLTGSCVVQTAVKEVLHFSTHVRTREMRSIVLNNRSNLLWQLRPKIDGAFWSGPDMIVVKPLQSKNYELMYRPLVMTHEGKRHQGSVFFPLPDGNGLLYNVTGVSEAPKAINNITRDVPCKTNYTELLTVNNWLKKPQRFRVVTEMVKPDKLDGSTTLKGLQYIDVPGQMKKDYKIDFFAHKEGTFSAKVIFKNEQTSEYLFYYVTFKATPPGIISTIDLTTPVRQSVSHVVSLYNPLTAQVNLSTAATLSDILLPPSFTVPPQSEGSFTFDYLPLKCGVVTGRLTLSSSELGFYQYDLNLAATPAGPENQVHFRTYLGSTQNQTCRFINFCKSRVEYLCKVDNSDFHVERSITAASASSGGTEVSVEVTYEPSCLGNSRAALLLTSPMGGDYTFPLYGYAAPPKPQGPYTIKAGASTSIPFKNVFPQATQFTFHVDNPVFTVKPTETIRAKKLHNVVVTFDGNQGNAKTTRMGRLVVASASSASLTHNIEWVYYLKGVTL